MLFCVGASPQQHQWKAGDDYDAGDALSFPQELTNSTLLLL